MTDIRYRIYPSLLGYHTEYEEAEATWEKYWGFSDDPPYTPEQWREKKRQDLIDRINRVPLELEVADKGTALNALTDWLACRRTTKGVELDEWRKGEDLLGWKVLYNGRIFHFPKALCEKCREEFTGCVPQVFVRGEFETDGGGVELYGFADYVRMDKVSDMKLTTSYSHGKYRTGWQHIVYPLCLRQMGSDIRLFEYYVAVVETAAWGVYREDHFLRPEEDGLRLRQKLEDFILFLERNRERITDRKIFCKE